MTSASNGFYWSQTGTTKAKRQRIPFLFVTWFGYFVKEIWTAQNLGLMLPQMNPSLGMDFCPQYYSEEPRHLRMLEQNKTELIEQRFQSAEAEATGVTWLTKQNPGPTEFALLLVFASLFSPAHTFLSFAHEPCKEFINKVRNQLKGLEMDRAVNTFFNTRWWQRLDWREHCTNLITALKCPHVTVKVRPPRQTMLRVLGLKEPKVDPRATSWL